MAGQRSQKHRQNIFKSSECYIHLIDIIYNFSVFDTQNMILLSHRHTRTRTSNIEHRTVLHELFSFGICYLAKLWRKHLYPIYHGRSFFIEKIKFQSIFFFFSAWFEVDWLKKERQKINAVGFSYQIILFFCQK